MLIKCPECNLNVSDKAISCPHCGYPLKKDLVTKKCRSTKRKRLPNGFGYITEIKNKNLRNPFRAMVTVGKNENGRPIAKLLKPQATSKPIMKLMKHWLNTTKIHTILMMICR